MLALPLLQCFLTTSDLVQAVVGHDMLWKGYATVASVGLPCRFPKTIVVENRDTPGASMGLLFRLRRTIVLENRDERGASMGLLFRLPHTIVLENRDARGASMGLPSRFQGTPRLGCNPLCVATTTV